MIYDFNGKVHDWEFYSLQLSFYDILENYWRNLRCYEALLTKSGVGFGVCWAGV